jgi:LysM repeat protein
MIIKNRSRSAALARLMLITAILLTSCSLQQEQPPTPTLIVLPTLAPSSTPPAPLSLPPTQTSVAVGVSPTPQVSGLITPTVGTATQPSLSQTAVASGTAPGPVTHTVQAGESLASIAATYGVTVNAILAANNLTNPNSIFVGQQLIIPSAAGTGTPSSAVCTRDAAFVSDVTMPPNTVVQPGQPFTKTWRIQNSGTCVWDNSFTMIFSSGNPMGARSFIPLPATAPGATVDISVPMIAPGTPGKFIGTWQIRGPDGIAFGVQPSLIIINMPSLVSHVTPIPPTAAPTTATQAAAPPPSSTTYPAVSGVTAHARQIYLAGKQLGNRRDVFSKVGDSLTDEPWFLHQIGDGQASFDKYGSLSPVVDFFKTDVANYGNSFNNTSVTAHGGWDSFSALDPANSTPYDYCKTDSPIVCELRVSKPSIVFIMFGTNDAADHLSSGTFEQNLTKMVQISIGKGVIPVLYTIPWNKFRDPKTFNTVITRVARANDIPLVDYWSVIDPLPNHGISDDGVHPSVPPDQNTANFSSDNLKYGYTVRNLVTLQVLDVIWRQALY